MTEELKQQELLPVIKEKKVKHHVKVNPYVIRHLIKRTRFTVIEFAEASGLSTGFVHNIMHNNQYKIRSDNYNKLLNFFSSSSFARLYRKIYSTDIGAKCYITWALKEFIKHGK